MLLHTEYSSKRYNGRRLKGWVQLELALRVTGRAKRQSDGEKRGEEIGHVGSDDQICKTL